MSVVTNIMTSTMENSIEISARDLELRNDRIGNMIVDKSHTAMSQKLEIRTLSLEYASNLEEMVDRKLVPWPKDTIFNTILENLNRKGITAVGKSYVYEAFNHEEYDRFKTIKKQGWRTSNNNNSSSNNNTKNQQQQCTHEKAAITSQINDALLVLEQNYDNPLIKERLAKYFAQYEKETRREKQQTKDLDRICMEHPEPQITSFYEALKKLAKTADIAAQRVLNYPPTDAHDDQYYTRGVLLYLKWLESIADLKQSRSNYSWIDIQIEKNSQSTHSAMSKSKIEAMSIKIKELNGMLRKVTREQIDAKEAEIIQLAKDLITMAPEITGDFTWHIIREVLDELIEEGHHLVLPVAISVIQKLGPILIAFDHYKDKYQAGWNGGFHLRRHEKLSESAFGNSTMTNQ